MFVAVVYLLLKLSTKLLNSEKSLNEIIKNILITSNFLEFSIQALTTSMLLVAAAFFIEILVLGYKKSTAYRIIKFKSKTLLNDFICWLLVTLGLFDFLFFISTFGVFHYLASLIFHNLSFRIDILINSTALLALIVFLVGDFKNYVFQRIVHLNPC